MEKVAKLFEINKEYLELNSYRMNKAIYELTKLAYGDENHYDEFNVIMSNILPIEKFGIRKVNRVFKSVVNLVNIILKNRSNDEIEKMEHYIEMFEIELLKHKYNIKRISGQELVFLENYLLYNWYY